MVVFVLYNCKDKETVAPEKASIEVLQEIDTSVQASPVKKEVEKSESNVAAQKTTTTEANKPIPTLIKVENSTTTVTDPVVKKKTEVVTDIPIETKTKTETEVVTDIPVDTKTEPIVIETPKAVDSKAWEVPYKYVTMKNPVPAKQDGSIAKSLYDKHCKSCHGKEGYGDGPKAAELTGNLGDFSSAKFQKQTDGELFYKTSFGRDDMPEFYKKIPDAEDIWLVVNYMRTLAE